MDPRNTGSKLLDSVENAIPFAMPALGGALGVIYVNLNKMDQLNPMIWIPLGIFLGWAAGRGILSLMDRFR